MSKQVNRIPQGSHGAQGSVLKMVGGQRVQIPITINRSPIKLSNNFSKTKIVSKKKWSSDVTLSSNAMNLEKGIFTKDSKTIAKSIKKSVEKRPKELKKKVSNLKSGMSMLSFYINRAGKKLSKERRKTIMLAKKEFKKIITNK